MPKVLILTYYCPPAVAVGGVRPTKFAKHLPAYGWSPYILTLPKPAIADAGRLKDLIGVPVHRVAPLPTVLDAYLGLKRRLRNVECQAVPDRNGAQPLPVGRPSRARLRARLSRYFSTCFELPDKEVGWLLPAVWRGLQIIRHERIDVLLATAPPTTPVLAGLMLSVLTRRPLVTDLRDPLILHGRKPADQRSALSDRLERWLERQIMTRSKMIVTTTAALTRSIRQRFPELPGGVAETITNGFDADDFPESPPAPPPKFVLSYLGTFYHGRTPRPLLTACRELIDEGTIDPADLDLVFCGDVAMAEGESVVGLAAERGLEQCLTLRGQVSHREALDQMRCSQVLLLLATDQPLQIPAKAFEYLGAGRPILCIGSGATADMIAEAQAGCVVAPGDFAGLKNALAALYRDWRSGRIATRAGATQQYERRALAARLARLLDDTLPTRMAVEPAQGTT